MTLRLTPAELEQITGGRTQPAAQVRWLRAHGFWLAERDNLGGCLLTWDHYRAVCAGAAPPRVEYAAPSVDQPRPRIKSLRTAA